MIRILLIKSWQHPNRDKPYPVGTILQCAPYLAGELLADKFGIVYTGEYPPKEKVKIDLSTIKQ